VKLAVMYLMLLTISILAEKVKNFFQDFFRSFCLVSNLSENTAVSGEVAHTIIIELWFKHFLVIFSAA
jgi:hypothetical protein